MANISQFGAAATASSYGHQPASTFIVSLPFLPTYILPCRPICKEVFVVVCVISLCCVASMSEANTHTWRSASYMTAGTYFYNSSAGHVQQGVIETSRCE